MISVVLLGFGNLGKALGAALSSRENVFLKQIYSRKRIPRDQQIEGVAHINDLDDLESADVIIIAIPDDDISAFSKKIPLSDSLVVHTSGGVSLNTLSEKNRRGVFYPLQTFSANRAIDFSSIPICIEAEIESDMKLLVNLGAQLSDKVVEINSEERKTLHLAAVFVNNFVNHLYVAAEEILNEHDLDFELLKPLILETAKKVIERTPRESQTGPAKRNDRDTIKKHLDLLDDGPTKDIYNLLTDAIQQSYGKKL